MPNPEAALTALLLQPEGIPASIPLRRDAGASSGSHGMGLFPALALVLLVAMLALWWMRKRQAQGGSVPLRKPQDWLKWLAPGGASSSLQVLQSARLTPRASLHRVRWEDQELLVGCTDHAIEVLDRRDIVESFAADPVRKEGT